MPSVCSSLLSLSLVHLYIVCTAHCMKYFRTCIDIACVHPPPGWPEDSWLWLVGTRSLLPPEHPLWYAWLPPPRDGGEQDTRWEGGPLGSGSALLWVPGWQPSLWGEECTAHICQNIKGGVLYMYMCNELGCYCFYCFCVLLSALINTSLYVVYFTSCALTGGLKVPQPCVRGS